MKWGEIGKNRCVLDVAILLVNRLEHEIGNDSGCRLAFRLLSAGIVESVPSRQTQRTVWMISIGRERLVGNLQDLIDHRMALPFLA